MLENELIPCTPELNHLKEAKRDEESVPAVHRWCDSCREYLTPMMAGTCRICRTKHY